MRYKRPSWPGQFFFFDLCLIEEHESEFKYSLWDKYQGLSNDLGDHEFEFSILSR